jgi:hypothetical protein
MDGAVVLKVMRDVASAVLTCGKSGVALVGRDGRSGRAGRLAFRVV